MKGSNRLTGSKVKLFAVVLLVFFVSAASQAQIPNRFHNLKVLPDLISKDELLHVMRGFTSSLGVRRSIKLILHRMQNRTKIKLV